MSSLRIDPKAPICTSGRRPHRTKAEAERELRVVRRQRLSDGSGGRRHANTEAAVRRCPACGWFHTHVKGGWV